MKGITVDKIFIREETHKKEVEMAKHLRKFIEELEAKGTSEIVARAQATIAAVEAGNAAGFLHSGAVCKNTIAAVDAGNAAGVGLAETAGIHAIVTELVYREAKKGASNQFGVDAAKFSKLVNIQAKLTHQLKQSAAWQYRINNVVPKDAGLGRNDSRVARRILKRGTSTADGCFDEAL